MEMMTRQLLLGFFLGLLAAVHSSPLGAVFNEAKTEGFLVNEQTVSSPSLEPFKTNTTSQAPQLSDAEGLGVRSEGSGQNPIGTSAVPTQDSSLTIESDEAPETPGTPQTTQWPQLEDSGEIPPSERSEGSGQNPSGTSAVPTQDSSLTIESDEAPETPGTPQTTQWPQLEDSGEIPPSERSEGSGQNPSGTSTVPTPDSSLTTQSDEAPETRQTTQRPHLESTTEGSGEITPSEQLEGSEQNPIGTSGIPTQDSSLTTESDKAPGTPQTTQWPQLEDSGEIPPSERSESSEQNPSGTSTVPTQDSSLTIESDEAPETPQTTQGPHLEIKKSPILSGERPLEKRITDNRHLKSPEGKSTSKTTHSRADWLIILGIAVGIVALLGLCVAVATRDKWNKDSSSSSVEKSNLLNQEREQEMQTFLHKNKPKENGQIGEYTVIPLNDIPEKY